MLVDHHEPVETDGESGRNGQAERECSDHDRNRRDPGSPLRSWSHSRFLFARRAITRETSPSRKASGIA